MLYNRFPYGTEMFENNITPNGRTLQSPPEVVVLQCQLFDCQALIYAQLRSDS